MEQAQALAEPSAVVDCSVAESGSMAGAGLRRLEGVDNAPCFELAPGVECRLDLTTFGVSGFRPVVVPS